jgi:hypothetical protein
MENSPKRLKKIKRMIEIAQNDAPWVWGINPKSMLLFHSWYSNIYPNSMANNTLKYRKIDGTLRREKIEEWNRPTITPLIISLLSLISVGFLLYFAYSKRQERVVFN